MFASDRDLLVLEPGLFGEVGWMGQMLVRGVGTIAGSTLTLTSADADLASAGVGPGYVVRVGEVSYEVIERLSAMSVSVSRVRDEVVDPVRPPAAVSGGAVLVSTMRPQIRLVHEQVLRMIGLEPGGGGSGRVGELGESAVTNPRTLARVEALGALHLIYAAAAAPGGDRSPASWWGKAMLYRQRFAQERERVAAQIDVDGDGLPDVVRRLNVVVMGRA